MRISRLFCNNVENLILYVNFLHDILACNEVCDLFACHSSGKSGILVSVRRDLYGVLGLTHDSNGNGHGIIDRLGFVVGRPCLEGNERFLTESVPELFCQVRREGSEQFYEDLELVNGQGFCIVDLVEQGPQVGAKRCSALFGQRRKPR